MKNEWKKVGRRVSADRTENIYENSTYPDVQIVSCKVKTENHSPRGFWEYTHYFVRLLELNEEKEFWRLKDAKEHVEKTLFPPVESVLEANHETD